MSWGVLLLIKAGLCLAMGVLLCFAFKWWLPAILERKADDPASIQRAKKDGLKLGLTGVALNVALIVLMSL